MEKNNISMETAISSYDNGTDVCNKIFDYISSNGLDDTINKLFADRNTKDAILVSAVTIIKESGTEACNKASDEDYIDALNGVLHTMILYGFQEGYKAGKEN